MVDYDPAARYARYSRVTPGSRSVLVEVRCAPIAAPETRVSPRYTLTALTEAGNAAIRAFVGDAYVAMIEEWRSLILDWLDRRAPDGPAATCAPRARQGSHNFHIGPAGCETTAAANHELQFTRKIKRNGVCSSSFETAEAELALTIQAPIFAATAQGLSRRIHAVQRQAKHLAEAAVLTVVMAVFACLPVDWASTLGGFIGRTAGPRIGASRRALRNLRQAMPENSDAENRRLLRGMWDNLCRAIAEYPHLAWISAEETGRVEIVNGDALTDLASDGKPSLLFSGHLANWEVCASTVHMLMGASLVSVYRAANNPWVDGLMRRFHAIRRAVPKGSSGGRELVRHLRHGGSVAMLVDQKQNDGIAVPFFGRNAMTAPAIARFGYRFGCPIIPVRVERLKGARFRCTVMAPIKMAETGDPARDVLATMTRVNAVLEGWIRARPEQWLWVHSRWPTAQHMPA